MRILILGAGATGGYFGGRLLEAGRDVTFLVRPGRAAELAQRGLTIRSRTGDYHAPSPPTIVTDQIREPFDLVILACKAYDLDAAICAITPAMGAETAILPVLNGIRHLDTLDATFMPGRVLGGRCLIAATLNASREIVHLNDVHELSFGERSVPTSPRVEAIEREFKQARCEHRASAEIVLEMWEKWVFLATLAASTCLCRASVGEICRSPGGQDLILNLFEEARDIAEASGYVLRQPFRERSLRMLTTADSPLTASMLRDLEANAPIEADHVIGDLIARGSAPLLSTVYTVLKAYEARRGRTGS